MAALFTAILSASWPIMAALALASLYSDARRIVRLFQGN